MKYSTTAEEYSKMTGVPVDVLEKNKKLYKELLSDGDDTILIPDCALGYLDSYEFKLFTHIIYKETYPQDNLNEGWDVKELSELLCIPKCRVNETRDHLLMMGLIKPVKKVVPHKNYYYKVDHKASRKLTAILVAIDEMDLWPMFRKYMGLRPVKRITVADINDFFDCMNLICSQ